MAREIVESEDSVQAVVDHTALGYGIVGMGAWQGEAEVGLLSALTAGVLAETTLPVLVVWPGPGARLERVRGFRRILVPVLATIANRAAQELAFSVAAASGAEVVITHIATPRGPSRTDGNVIVAPESGRRVAQAIVGTAAQLARQMGLRPRSVVRVASSRRDEIASLVAEYDVDLVMLSAEIQQAGSEVFLGSLVEDLIAGSTTTVAMLATPGGWGVGL